MSAMIERRVNADFPPATYKPTTPHPTRLVLEIGHTRFLLPEGLSVQEAAALVYTLGQSVQVTRNYDAVTGAYKTRLARPCDFNPIALSIADPKDVTAATSNTEDAE